MQAVVFAIHLIISLALVGVILLQRSEGGALGIGGGSNSMVSGRGAASLLTRTTAILAGLFFITSLTLAALAGIKKKNDGLNFDAPLTSTAPSTAPLSAPLTAPLTAPSAPAAPVAPVLPAIPEKTSSLQLAPKPSAAAAAPAATQKKPAPVAAVPAPSAKPAIPEPTEEVAPAPVAPVAPAGPTDTGSGAASGGGSRGPQPR